jgi:hypothetical protein
VLVAITFMMRRGRKPDLLLMIMMRKTTDGNAVGYQFERDNYDLMVKAKGGYVGEYKYYKCKD